jgi:hypothetical protein
LVHESTRILPEDVQLIDELPVMRPERVLFELASSTRSTFDRLARRGVRGVTALRVALDRWDPTIRATESEMETLLLQLLRDNGLPDAEPQYDIFDRDGRFVARVDVGLRKYKAGVEYDSDQEHSDELSIARDNTRRLKIEATGHRVFVARYRDVKNGGADLLRALRAHCHAEPA